MAAKLCSLCNFRRVGTGPCEDISYAISMGYCGPCTDEADMWNDHHNDHDRSKLACWICRPELNLATLRDEPRKGHTNTVAKTRGSHAGCNHESTPKARAACRALRAAADRDAAAGERPHRTGDADNQALVMALIRSKG